MTSQKAKQEAKMEEEAAAVAEASPVIEILFPAHGVSSTAWKADITYDNNASAWTDDEDEMDTDEEEVVVMSSIPSREDLTQEAKHAFKNWTSMKVDWASEFPDRENPLPPQVRYSCT